MKYDAVQARDGDAGSRSARTARIEISPPLDPVDEPESRSARTARIEIASARMPACMISVAVRKDRED